MTPTPSSPPTVMSGAGAGTLAYLTASVLWGLNVPLSAALLQTFDPLLVSALRYLIAAALLGLMVLASSGLAAWRSPIALWRVGTMSLFVAGFLQLYNLGLFYTHPMTVAALSAGSPVYVAVVSKLMTGSRLPPGFAGASALTLLGGGITIYGRAQASGQALAVGGGELLVVLAICSWTVYSILSQRWFPAATPQLRRTFLTTVGTLPWLLASWGLAYAQGWVQSPGLALGPEALLQLLVAGVFCTALATVAWNIGVNRQGIHMGSIWQNMVPVFAVLISMVFFGIDPLPSQLIGGAVVLTGVLFMQWRRSRHA